MPDQTTAGRGVDIGDAERGDIELYYFYFCSGILMICAQEENNGAASVRFRVRLPLYLLYYDPENGFLLYK